MKILVAVKRTLDAYVKVRIRQDEPRPCRQVGYQGGEEH